MAVNLSTSAFYEKATRQMTSLRGQANELQEQVGTGQRLTRSSQDPVAAARLRTLARSDRLAAIDQTGSDTAMSELELVDSALGSMADIVARVRELAMQAGTGTLSAAQRTTLGVEVADLRTTLLTIANGANGAGHALFGGEGAGTAYTDNAGTITYAGSATGKAIDLGEGQQVLPSLTGPQVLEFEVAGVPTDLFAVLGTLAASLQGDGSDPVAASQAALTGLSAGLEKITTSQTIIGARMNWVELMDERRTTNGELRTAETDRLGSADPATTISRLQQVMTVLEASQASFVQLSSLSLFNELR